MARSLFGSGEIRNWDQFNIFPQPDVILPGIWMAEVRDPVTMEPSPTLQDLILWGIYPRRFEISLGRWNVPF